MFHIGSYKISGKLILAPMAGISDKPFRNICRQYGAALTISEMLTSDQRLWNSSKSKWRLNFNGEIEPIVIQITGSDPEMMANAAQMLVKKGAHIIDINMGCPAQKVCGKAAGAALLRNEKLVANILNSVVNNVSVPVTLKIRTGWDKQHKNAVSIAKIAENSGVSSLTIHGRTKACGFHGEAEYDTIAEVKSCVGIPIIANGSINNPEQAKYVLDYTKADAIMIGRAAKGQPWVFKQINHFLNTGQHLTAPNNKERLSLIKKHLIELIHHYGEFSGIRIARKHIGWYLEQVSSQTTIIRSFNTLTSLEEQLTFLQNFFDTE